MGGCGGEGNAARSQWPFQHQQRHGQVFKRDRKQKEACLFHQCATPSSLNQVLWTSWMAATDPVPAGPDAGKLQKMGDCASSAYKVDGLVKKCSLKAPKRSLVVAGNHCHSANGFMIDEKSQHFT